MVETIDFQTTAFQCTKNYGSATHVTRLKVAPNMADLLSIKARISKTQDSSLKGVLHPRPVFELLLHFSQKLQHIGNK